MTDVAGQTRVALTDLSDYYQFEEVRAGESYTFSAEQKHHLFAPRAIFVNEALENLNLAAAL